MQEECAQVMPCFGQFIPAAEEVCVAGSSESAERLRFGRLRLCECRKLNNGRRLAGTLWYVWWWWYAGCMRGGVGEQGACVVVLESRVYMWWWWWRAGCIVVVEEGTVHIWWLLWCAVNSVRYRHEEGAEVRLNTSKVANCGTL